MPKTIGEKKKRWEKRAIEEKINGRREQSFLIQYITIETKTENKIL